MLNLPVKVMSVTGGKEKSLFKKWALGEAGRASMAPHPQHLVASLLHILFYIIIITTG